VETAKVFRGPDQYVSEINMAKIYGNNKVIRGKEFKGGKGKIEDFCGF
jgi:hypothetical protein